MSLVRAGMFLISGFLMAYNGFGLDAGREIEAQKFNLPQLPNSIPKVEDSTEALLAFKPLLVAVNIGISNLSELKPKVVEEAN